MTRPRHQVSRELTALVVGVVFGIGTNLVTADAQHWPGWLQPVNRYAPTWLPAAVVCTVAVYLLTSWRSWRRRPWTGRGNPYPGLEAFGEDRAGVFFGRDHETQELVEWIAARTAAAAVRFVPVVGPSGSGKSSLVQAGVVPAVRRAGWAVAGPLLPGADPFADLVRVLAGAESTTERRALARLIRTEADQALAAATSGAPPPVPHTTLGCLVEAKGSHRHLLLVVDQLEETVSLAGTADRQAFVALLWAALTADRRLHVIASLRVEFLRWFQEEPGAQLFRYPYGLGAMSASQIRGVVVRPAEAAGVAFADGLVEQIVADATGVDALPLLGHLLRQLFERASGGVITADEYDRVGQVAGAVAAQADLVLGRLSAVYSLDTVLETLLNFIAWEGPEPTRRRVAEAELDPTAQAVVAEFREARLVVHTAEQKAFDLAHEALLRQWLPLAERVRARESVLRQRTELEPLARAWQLNGHRSDYLIGGGRLREAVRVVDRTAAAPTVAAFVRASTQAEQTRLDALGDQLASQAIRLRHRDPELAMALAATAITECGLVERTRFVLDALLTAAERAMPAIADPGDAWAVHWLPDGRLAVAADTTVRIAGPDGGLAGELDLRVADTPNGLLELAWSPDGRVAALDSGDSRIRIWDTGAGWPAPVRELDTGTEPDRLAWLPDGRLAWCVPGGQVYLVDGDRPQGRHRGNGGRTALPGAVLLRWGADGHLAMVRPDGSLRVRRPGEPDDRAPTRGTREARSVAWSPTGSLAFTGTDQSVWLWDPISGTESPIHPGDSTHALGGPHPPPLVAWSPTGWLAYWLPGEAQLRLWYAWDLDEVTLDLPDPAPVWSMAWSAADQLACVVGTTAWTWNLGRPADELAAEMRARKVRPLTAAERERYLAAPAVP